MAKQKADDEVRCENPKCLVVFKKYISYLINFSFYPYTVRNLYQDCNDIIGINGKIM